MTDLSDWTESELDDLRAALAKLSDEVIECNADRRHTLSRMRERRTVIEMVTIKGYRAQQVTRKCKICGTVRKSIFYYTYRKLVRYHAYDWPDEYRPEGFPEGRIPHQLYVEEWLRRLGGR